MRRWSDGEPLKFRVADFAELQNCIAASAILHTSDAAAASSATSSQAISISTAVPRRLVLYYFPRGSSTWWHDRVKVDDEDTFADYVAVYGNRPLLERPILLLWVPPTDCTEVLHHTAATAPCDHSPLKDSLPPAQPFISLQPAVFPSSPSVCSGSSCSSIDHTFAEEVYTRDGKRCVVADCEANQVEAAHIVPVGEARSPEGKAAAGLFNLYETINGICLCTTCHDYFDAGVSVDMINIPSMCLLSVFLILIFSSFLL